MTLHSDGGILHGTWLSEVAMSTSERRLKRGITDLSGTLQEIVPKSSEKYRRGRAQELPPGKIPTGDDALWVLRQLRPVSYSFKSRGPEAKYMRFGFIAEELETVIPQVVRDVGGKSNEVKKAVLYQDLIALLAAAAQSHLLMSEQFSVRLEQIQQQHVKDIEELREQVKQLASTGPRPPAER